MEERFRELLALVQSDARLHEAIELLSEELLYRRPPVPDGHFAQLDGTGQLTLDTVLTKREGLLQRVMENGKYATVQFSGNKVTGPRKISPALHFISTLDRFKVRDLPGLGDEEKVVLARNLVKEGLLKVV